jgi:hypothetical protein
VPTVARKDTGKMNVPSGPETPRRPPRPEAEAKLLKESITLLRKEASPGRKTLSGWPLLRIMMRTRADWAPFYWAPSGYGPNEDRGPSC